MKLYRLKFKTSDALFPDHEFEFEALDATKAKAIAKQIMAQYPNITDKIMYQVGTSVVL